MVSSFRSWYCTESSQPALMWRILPTYLSDRAQMVSWPHGFGTFTTPTGPDPGFRSIFFAMHKYRTSMWRRRAEDAPNVLDVVAEDAPNVLDVVAEDAPNGLD